MMTVGFPPSITATTEFVVPRSIPTALPIAATPVRKAYALVPSVSAPVGCKNDARFGVRKETSAKPCVGHNLRRYGDMVLDASGPGCRPGGALGLLFLRP